MPKETAGGETRVALVPEIVRKLTAKDFEVVVQSGAGEGSMLADAVYEDAGATIGEDVWTADVVVKVAAPSDEEIAKLGKNTVLIGFLGPLSNPEDHAGAGRCRRHRLRDGGDPAHLARPVDGRAVFAVKRRRLQVGARRDEPPRPLPADDDDRRRHRPAGEGARARRGRRGPAGDRDRAAPGRPGHRLRRARRHRRAGALARRAVPRARGRQGRRGRGRVRARADRRGEAGPAAGARRQDRDLRRRHHDGAGARAGRPRGLSPPRAWRR